MNDYIYNYTQALNYIHSLGKYSNPPHKDLTKIKFLCSLFNNPQDSYKIIHVAGTNGKGSAASMLANILCGMGYKTGRFISPFIVDFTERISIINNYKTDDISREDIIYYTNKIIEIFEENNVKSTGSMPNEFEFITLLAFLYYRDKYCEFAVIETGLGGRLDPTNAVESPLASVIMSVSLDHMKVLNCNTVEEIAVEKCGIIKQNSKVIFYPLNKQSVLDIAKNIAREKNCGFIMPDISSLEISEENLNFTEFKYKNKNYKIKLAGRHQVYNAVTVIETIECLFGDSYKSVYNGVKNTFFPARFEILSKNPLVIFDGAHNMDGIAALRETIKNLLPGKKIILICGMLKDKRPELILKEICGEDFIYKFIAVPVDSPRSESPENLMKYAGKYCANAEYNYNLRDAVKNALSGINHDNIDNLNNFAVICFGSLYLASEVKKIINS